MAPSARVLESRLEVVSIETGEREAVYATRDHIEAPNWSLRVSLANLPDEAYEDIGRGVRTVARGYRDAYEASKTGHVKEAAE